MTAVHQRFLNPIMWLDPIFYNFTALGRKQNQYNEAINKISDEVVYMKERELSAKDDPTQNLMNLSMKEPCNSRVKKRFDASTSMTNHR